MLHFFSLHARVSIQSNKNYKQKPQEHPTNNYQNQSLGQNLSALLILALNYKDIYLFLQ